MIASTASTQRTADQIPARAAARLTPTTSATNRPHDGQAPDSIPPEAAALIALLARIVRRQCSTSVYHDPR
ncbi:MAG TPA: hypothetical protein VNL71_08720 [Chloroflexota bacterium]|nr:hypothetical protein [Chloroflexota bacterium]